MTRWITLLLVCFAGLAQTPPAAEKPGDTKEPEEGIPVTSELVRQNCGGCHAGDAKQQMSRISFRRTTPEGWQQTIRRMVSLNNVKLEPDVARRIVKYLADSHGLAPEEAKPAYFEVEKRVIDFKYAASSDTEQTCNKCHSIGRVMLQRRTKPEWERLLAMHRGYYPLIDFQAFRRMGPPQTQPGPDGRPPDNRHPMDKALGHLSEAFPLITPEWSAWSANRRTPRLAGRWMLTGYQLGKGPVYGEVQITAGENDEFATDIRWTYARSGESVARKAPKIPASRLPSKPRSTA